jgi:hypothetical protein
MYFFLSSLFKIKFKMKVSAGFVSPEASLLSLQVDMFLFPVDDLPSVLTSLGLLCVSKFPLLLWTTVRMD